MDGEVLAHPDINGWFMLYNVNPGTHYLEVFHPKYQFPSILVEVTANSEPIAYFNTPGTVKTEKVPYPLRLAPERQITYFEVPESFSLRGLFANPMYIMFAVAILMTMCMPKMQLDPEQMKQMQDMQKQMKGNWLMNMFQQ